MKSTAERVVRRIDSRLRMRRNTRDTGWRGSFREAMRRAFFSGKHLPQWLESESGRLVRVLILISLSIRRLMK